jgi:hypothetical protein
VGLNELGQLKKTAMTSSEIELATLSMNQLWYHVLSGIVNPPLDNILSPFTLPLSMGQQAIRLKMSLAIRN